VKKLITRALLVAIALLVVYGALFAFEMLRMWWLRHSGTPQCELSVEAGRGRLWAGTCAGCHDLDIRMPDRPSGGPNLHNVHMSIAGTESLRYNYKYNPPMVAARNSGLIWTDENLDDYLHNPKQFLESKTGLAFPDHFYMGSPITGNRAEDVQSRRDVIAFLREIKGRPCECAVTNYARH
jgi:cytochrome c